MVLVIGCVSGRLSFLPSGVLGLFPLRLPWLVVETLRRKDPQGYHSKNSSKRLAWLTDTTARPLATERVSVDWVDREP